MSQRPFRVPLRRAVLLAAALQVCAGTAALAAGDATAGQAVFAKHCAICHTATEKNKIGPGLAGVFGRPAGTAAGFHYSQALIKFARPWDEPSLDDFLSSPSRAVHGTAMTASLPNATDRGDVIAYLKTLSAQP